MSQNRLKNSYIFIPIVIAISIAVGYMMGIGVKSSNTSTNNANINTLITKLTKAGLKYSDIFYYIQNSYVDSINIDSISESVIPDLLSKLDPHSSYIPARSVSLSQANLEGKFDGIGVVFNMITDTIIIQSVVPGGPSSKVGIESGDRIITINDSVVAGKMVNQDSILSKLRGEGGSKVKLGIERRGIDSLINIVVTRGKVTINSVDAAFMIKPTVGYIKLVRFARTSHQEVVAALDKLKKEGMEHIILDLTGNRGGYLDQAIYIANEFLPAGSMIVTTQKQGGVTLAAQEADGKGRYIGQDVIVLVNENSASSSEIVAGALQDNDIGTIIGRRTFGKGLVQQQIPLSDGSLLNLTIARYHTPTGRCIQRSYDGTPEEYEMDYYNRAIHGELTNRDSVKLDTTKRYVTPNGKVVYGGGGIMPDIFVPYDTVKYNNVERKLLISLVLVRYTNKYIDNNRDKLLKIKGFAELVEYFVNDNDKLYRDYIEYVNAQGANISEKEAKDAYKKVNIYLKAYVGQFLKDGDDSFYRYILSDDEIVTEALKEINKKVR